MATHKQHGGFTLIELMITLGVLAVVMSVGIPAFNSTITRNNVVAEANRLLSSINFARSQAVTKGQVVTLYRAGATSQNWSQGWFVFTDTGGEGVEDFVVGDIQLKNMETSASSMTIQSNISASNAISFNASGRIINLGNIELAICDSNLTSNVPGRLIEINRVGRTTISRIDIADLAANCVP
ncbi:MAG: GspH/FimT family pseudopilin [Spongiibacteraceae bacterium]|nr:GspH/FimT family pseudopilin [Spongiibacteraceae bacterium]